MSTPYPPTGGGQQAPGPYGAPGPSSWGAGPGGQPYGTPGAPGQGYGAFGGPGAPQGYGQGPGQQGPGQQGPGQQPPSPYGPPGQQGPGQYGPGPQGPGQQGPGQQGPGQQGPSGQFGTPPQKAPKPPKPPKAPRQPVDLNRILPLALAALGLLGFIFGFLHALSVDDNLGVGAVSVYATYGYLPILVVLVGLFGVAPLLPGGKKYTLPTALLSVATLLAAITALTSATSGLGSSVGRGAGLILLLIVALLQAAVAVYGWLTESGGLKPAGGRGGASSKLSPGQLPPVFVPAPDQQSGGRPSGDRGGSGSYSPGAFGDNPPNRAPEAGAYGGYQPADYRPSGSSGDSFGSFAPAGSDPAASQYGSGPGEQSDSHGAQRTSGSADQAGRPEPTDKPRQGEEPPPDVTQQVRF